MTQLCFRTARRPENKGPRPLSPKETPSRIRIDRLNQFHLRHQIAEEQ